MTPLAGGAVLQMAAAPEPPAGVALVLHGGRELSSDPVRAWNLAVLRMLPIARSLGAVGQPSGLAVARLRYGVRGWNGPARSPVADVRAALVALAERFPDTPVALVGHSMGARAALHAADHPAVRAVVALAPWITSDDPLEPVRDRRLLIVHGRADRVTDPAASCAYAGAVAPAAASCCWVGVRGEGHVLLLYPGLYRDLVAGFVLGALGLAAAPGGPVTGWHRRLVRRALAGQPSVGV